VASDYGTMKGSPHFGMGTRGNATEGHGNATEGHNKQSSRFGMGTRRNATEGGHDIASSGSTHITDDNEGMISSKESLLQDNAPLTAPLAAEDGEDIVCEFDDKPRYVWPWRRFTLLALGNRGIKHHTWNNNRHHWPIH